MTKDNSYAPSIQASRTRLLLVFSLAINFLFAILLRIYGAHMYPFFIIIYAWVAAYAFFLSMVLRSQRLDSHPLIQGRKSIVLLILLTIGMRVTFLGVDELISLDPLWYLDFGKFMKQGFVPYFDFYFPYPPVFAYVILPISIFAPSVDSFRLVSLSLDVLVVLLLWKISLLRGNKFHASIAPLAYSMLPISIIESGWNGHFEPLVNVLVLVALLFLLENRWVLSGSFLGLAIATKVYPVLLLPVGFFFIDGWKDRFRFGISSIVTAIVTFLPILALYSINSSSGTGSPADSTSPTRFMWIVLTSLVALDSQRIIVTFFGIIAIVLGLIIIIRQTLVHDRQTTFAHYHWSLFVLAMVLIVMGLVAGIYPLLPTALLVYWRYPLDVAMVRMFTTVAFGTLILVYSIKGIKKKRAYRPSSYSVLLQISFIILLIASLIREVFYGWYLLWAIPVLLLVRDRKIGLTILICLLLFYPSYTHDNFVSLGFTEPRTWQDEFDTVDGWFSSLKSSSYNESPHEMSWYSYSNNSFGHFAFNASGINNLDALGNISIFFDRFVRIEVTPETEFVSRITTTWDPTFGPVADVALRFYGYIVDDLTPVNGSIIPLTGLFSNLTFLLWRFSFSSWNASFSSAIINWLVLEVVPRKATSGEVIIDFFYMTESSLYSPLYLAIAPALIAFSLAAYAVLKQELDVLEALQSFQP